MRISDWSLDVCSSDLMLAGQPIAATIGYGTKADLIAPLSLDLNGNAITLSNKVLSMIEPGLPKGTDGKVLHPHPASALKPVAPPSTEESRAGKQVVGRCRALRSPLY